MNIEKTIVAEIEKVLLVVWDPLNIQDEPAAMDEYATFALRLAGLRSKLRAPSDIRDVLRRFEQDDLSFTPREDRTAIAAERIFALLSPNTSRSSV
jgi:hypothetical protein